MRARWFEYPNNFFAFANKMKDEADRAAQKFPQGENLGMALAEECGEAAKALLHIREQGGSPEDVYKELIQVAATAYRLATLGDDKYGYNGTKCHYSECPQPCTGGPCALCYA